MTGELPEAPIFGILDPVLHLCTVSFESILAMKQPAVTLEQIASLCKRRGFAYPTAEIYGGLNGVYDFGPLGYLLKQNIQNAWIHSLQSQRGKEILFMEGSILGTESMWEASGHTTNFHDPLIDCTACKHRFRADDIDIAKACPHCGKHGTWTDVREFHLMFKTAVGAAAGSQGIAYLRPETAQSIFVNFKNVMSSNRVKIPFGVAQMGKAFRNEITPKQFLFRVREFEQMEMEWFCQEADAAAFYDFWIASRRTFFHALGIKPDNIRVRAHGKDELSHYSRGTSDVEYQFPFGWKELEGIANRGDYDLKQHSTHSGKELSVFDDTTKQSYYPHVVECSVGIGRLFLALLCDAYREETVENEQRIVLALHPSLAPVKAAFLPLVKEQNAAMEELYHRIKTTTGLSLHYDPAGSIGKRYRRQDEIGTPLCFTYDFESASDGCVTVRYRDSMEQERIPFAAIEPLIRRISAFPHSENS